MVWTAVTRAAPRRWYGMLLIRTRRIGALLAAVLGATAVFAAVAPVSALAAGRPELRPLPGAPVDPVAILHLLWL